MRVLWLAPYLPVPTFGGGTRTFNLIKAMSRTCEIDLIAGDESPPDQVPAELRALCRSIRVVPRPISSRRRKRWLQLRSLLSRRSAQFWLLYSAEMQGEINQAIRAGEYDVAIMEHSFMGCYTVPGTQTLVLDQHNVECEIFRRAGQHERSLLRRAYNSLEFRKYRDEEQRICRTATLVLATSDLDRNVMMRWRGMPPCVVVANGVDAERFAPQRVTRDETGADILFFGSMHYAPNTQAMLFFADKVWPRIRRDMPGATLSIVGMNPPREIQSLGDRAGISVAGFVPDIRPHLAGTKVAVVPLRIGGGTRLKILEALAMGTAVVSTSVGCEGLDVENGRHLLIADDPQEIADSVVALLRDPERRQALGSEGRQLVQTLYDWRVLGIELENALADVLGRSRPRAIRDGEKRAASASG